MRNLCKAISILWIGYFCLACSNVTSQINNGEASMLETTYTVYSNSQMVTTELQISVGNFFEEEFTETDGQVLFGETARLWIFSKDDPAERMDIRVHPKQELDFAGYTIYVQELGENKRGKFVILRIEPDQ